MVPVKEGKEVEGNTERSDGKMITNVFLLLGDHELGFRDALSVVLVGELSASEAGNVRELLVGGGKAKSQWRSRSSSQAGAVGKRSGGTTTVGGSKEQGPEITTRYKLTAYQLKKFKKS